MNSKRCCCCCFGFCCLICGQKIGVLAGDKICICFGEYYLQCDQIWRNFDNLEINRNLRQHLKGLFDIWQSCKPTLGLFVCFWAKFHRCKWPNIEKTIWPSGHTGHTGAFNRSKIVFFWNFGFCFRRFTFLDKNFEFFSSYKKNNSGFWGFKWKTLTQQYV